MRLRNAGKTALNSLAALFGVRLVSASWGPRGVFATLGRTKSRGFSPALIFDIGASDGQWTRECQGIFPESKYILVDPLDSNREALLRLTAADARVSAWYGAAGASSGHLQIYDHGDQSSALPSKEFSDPARNVAVCTVDALYQAAGSAVPVLIKADVQGFELEVLKGATQCLASTQLLVLEVSYRRMYEGSALAHEIIAYVGERGFRIFDICSYLQRPADRELVQSDIVFVHESSPLLDYQGWGEAQNQ
jgi:FkbM family methyltransferase